MPPTTRRTIALVITAAALLGLAGCASLPTPEAMRTEVAGYQLPKLPDAGKAMVYVVRPSGLGGLIRFNVHLGDQQDASEMGFTRGGQYIHFHVPPGTHTLYSKAENWAEIAITVAAGDVVFIEQEPAMGILMARNSLKMIDELPGRYHVKKLTPGTLLRLDK